MELESAEIVGQKIITTAPTEDGGTHIHEIDLAALASWSELLGIEDPGEVLDAIMFVAEHGEPEPDPVTGENAWTGAYLALQDREQARAATTYVAQVEGRSEDPRSPKLRAAFAALPLQDPVAKAQAATRAKLGLPDPGALRMARTMSRGAPTPLDDLKAALTTDLAASITEARQEFLATLRPQITD